MRRIRLLGLALLVITWAGASVSADVSLQPAFTPGVIFGLNRPGFSEGFSDDFMMDIGGLAWINDYDSPVFRLELGLGAFAETLPGIRAIAHVSLYAWENALISLGGGLGSIRNLDTDLTYGSAYLEVQALVETHALGANFGKLEIGVQLPIGYDHLLLLWYVGCGLEWYF